MLGEADRLLQRVFELGVPLVDETGPVADAEALAQGGFSGVRIEVDDEDPSDDDLLRPPRKLRRAVVDVPLLLREILQPQGFDVGDEEDGFFPLTSVAGDDPSRPAFFFGSKNDTPPFAIRARVENGRPCVVLHANQRIDDALRNTCRVFGVEPVRLAALASKQPAEVAEQASLLAPLLEALEEATPDIACIQAKTRAEREADPQNVVEYASTEQANPFEGAVARILEGVIDYLFPLGKRFAGKPYPDGLIACRARDSIEVMSYDCKSKKGDAFAPGPKEGDQQSRYTRVLDRLADSGWTPRGIVLFTPQIDEGDFQARMERDYWRRMTGDGHNILAITARALRRWWDLGGAEDVGFSRRLLGFEGLWSAMIDGTLGGLTEAAADVAWPLRRRQAKVIGEQEAELAWLAGLQGADGMAVVEALAGTEGPDANQPISLARPAILRRFYEVLRRSKPTLSKVAAYVGLSPRATFYLVRARRFEPSTAEEWGEKGVANLKSLREENLTSP